MTDKELLELAAKAVGIKGPYLDYKMWEAGKCYGPYDGDGIYVPDDDVWSPLTDDGDALRLAVKLRILDLGETMYQSGLALNDVDDYAATRRAIVRAAAEIGKEMK